jgi:hypothetical protein
VHQAVERGVERVGIAAQCGVGELRATTGDGGGALEQLAHAGREGAIAGVDGVLGLADEVGEADLMILLGPPHLGCEPVGNPELRAISSQEPLDHGPAAVGMDDEAGPVGVMEPPGPPVLLADPHTGFVGRKDGAGESCWMRKLARPAVEEIPSSSLRKSSTSCRRPTLRASKSDVSTNYRLSTVRLAAIAVLDGIRGGNDLPISPGPQT